MLLVVLVRDLKYIYIILSYVYTKHISCCTNKNNISDRAIPADTEGVFDDSELEKILVITISKNFRWNVSKYCSKYKNSGSDNFAVHKYVSIETQETHLRHMIIIAINFILFVEKEFEVIMKLTYFRLQRKRYFWFRKTRNDIIVVSRRFCGIFFFFSNKKKQLQQQNTDYFTLLRSAPCIQ